MDLFKKFCFVYLILHLTLLLFVDSSDYDDYEERKKYNGSVPNENKTCLIAWETSIMSEPTPTCWIMCKIRCILLSRTTQWRCKISNNQIWENCHCCNDDTSYATFDFY
ncbi:uncharacterized protein LOC100570675 [Acyrthosiphon pisum]|uniref:Uncharacterized protein n=1 Tax=Acyrthosiphon pisum TaxID=7029 RepID=A0A8R2A6Y2_ACYPI|nr:uncharacterized protein LOC100570675 [Acyrthosiphon pisum]|eukprot:XP_003248063.1 PREDICTED: uncharacterized protein LOC100570675 [Acyrthosiphon pisum]